MSPGEERGEGDDKLWIWTCITKALVMWVSPDEEEHDNPSTNAPGCGDEASGPTDIVMWRSSLVWFTLKMAEPQIGLQVQFSYVTEP